MKIEIVPRLRAMEKIESRRRREINPGREQSMATKEKPSRGGSGGQERGKRAEAHSRGRDADKSESSRGSRAQSDDKREGDSSRGSHAQSDEKHEASSEREQREGPARAQAEGAEQSGGAGQGEQSKQDESNGKDQSRAASDRGRPGAELDLGRVLEDQVAQAVHPILE